MANASGSEMVDIAARRRMPPYCVYQGFLEADAHDGLLAWAIANEAKFEPTTLGGEERVDASLRVSLGVRDFELMKAILHQRVLDFVPTLIRDLRVTPFEPSEVTLELVAHNDGAFYTRHTDLDLGGERSTSYRLLSAVYYFHAEPKAFSGGALRLEQFGADFVDVQPEQNTLLVFPSWAPHEVLPVSCPSRRFSDSRFAVNCWVHRHSSEIRVE